MSSDPIVAFHQTSKKRKEKKKGSFTSLDNPGQREKSLKFYFRTRVDQCTGTKEDQNERDTRQSPLDFSQGMDAIPFEKILLNLCLFVFIISSFTKDIYFFREF